MTGAVIKAAGGNAIVRAAGGGIIGAAIVGAPTLASVSPSSGVDTGGTLLTLAGTNLTGATAVTLGGSAVGSYTVVNSTTITFTSPAHADGAVNITVTTPSGTSGAVSFTYNPPSTGSVFTTYQVRNALAGASTNPPHEFGHTFAPGEIPAGSYPEMRPTGTGSPLASFQWDEVSTRADGSWRFAVGTMKATGVYAAYQSTGDIKGYDFVAKTGTPPYSTSTITPTTIAAASQIQLRLSGGDFATELGSTTEYYYVDLNDILANHSRDTWGLNPTGGWELVQSGSVCNKYWAWGCAKRHSDNAIHKWLVICLEVKVFSTGQYRINPVVVQPWIYGAHPSGTVGPAATAQPHVGVPAQPRYAGFYELWDAQSNTLIGALGGPNDTNGRAFTIPAANFTGTPTTPQRLALTSQIINYQPTGMVPGGGMPQSTGWMFQAASGGTLPSGIDPNWVYWVGAPQPGNTLFFGMERMFTPGFGSGYPSWSASTAVAETGGFFYNNAAYYYPIAGTTGSTPPVPNPIGSGANPLRTDGSAQYVAETWTVGSAGSGNIIALPVCATWGNTAINMLDKNCEPFWYDPINHTAKPWTLPMPNFNYTTKSSRCVPPYKASSIPQDTPTPIPDAGLEMYSPNDLFYDFGGGDWNPMQAPGDDLLDQRISAWNQRAVLRLYQPGDRNTVIRSKCIGARWFNHWQWGWDHRTGRPPLINLGHDRAGSDYPGFPAGTLNQNLYWHTEAASCLGSPAPMGVGMQIGSASGHQLKWRHSPGYESVYGQVINGSHCPNPSLSDRVLDGSYIALQNMQTLHMGTLAYVPGGYRNSIAGFPGLGGLVSFDIGQIRAHGWDMCKQANVMMFTPDWHLFTPYLKDNIADQSAYFNGLKNYVDTNFSAIFSFWGTMGPQNSNFPGNNVGFWMFGHEQTGLTFSALALGDDYPGFIQAMNDFLPGLVRLYDPANGGCLYYMGMGQIINSLNGAASGIPNTVAGMLMLNAGDPAAGQFNNSGQNHGGTFVCPGVGQQSPHTINLYAVPGFEHPQGLNIFDGYGLFQDPPNGFCSGFSSKEDSCSVPLMNIAPIAIAAHVMGPGSSYATLWDACWARMHQGGMIGPTCVDGNTWGSFHFYLDAH